ncbi:nitrite reductase (NAD(P)H) small subunit, partial [Actinomadura sp. NPDC049382]|uniref:nitrite reductase (NAD(P)H) small subunit n=1 Tax=Actinomadura sp. NPDC049382 TaxID=3158220 RepID=UPI003436C433
ERGVCAMVDGVQVAVFRVYDGALYALSNLDPATRTSGRTGPSRPAPRNCLGRPISLDVRDRLLLPLEGPKGGCACSMRREAPCRTGDPPSRSTA